MSDPMIPRVLDPFVPGASVFDAPVACESGATGVDSQMQGLRDDIAQLKQQLRRAQRLASLGTTAPVLAHEIKNLLTPVLGYAKFALDQNDTSMMPQALQTTVERIGAVMDMTARLLAMASDAPPAYRLVGLADVVEEAVRCLCRDPSKDGIVLTCEIPPELRAWGDARQLQQVIFNLLLNARDALTGRKGRIAIAARAIPGDMVELTCQDTGEGIAPEHLDRVFDVFFTTKNGAQNGRKSGSGLGLAICRDIVREHHGEIRVESRVGEGSTFTITLPKARRS